MCWTLFHVLIGLSQRFLLMFNWVVSIFIIKLGVLYIFWMKAVCQIYALWIFSASLWLLCSVLMMSFDEQNKWIFFLYGFVFRKKFKYAIKVIIIIIIPFHKSSLKLTAKQQGKYADFPCAHMFPPLSASPPGWYLCYNEPIMTHQNDWKSIVYSEVHSYWCTLCFWRNFDEL